MDEWGGDLPSIINGKSNLNKSSIPLPPPIGALKTSGSLDLHDKTEDDMFPDDDDLGYPGESVKEELEPLDSGEPSQRFLSADELMDEEEEEEEATDPSYTLPDNFNNDLEKEVDADISPDDFWAVDSKDEVESNENKKSPSHKFKNQEELEEEDVGQGLVEKKYSQDISIEELKPIIEEIVKKYCENTVSKIAWEVIPDLAENLIKEELKEISQKIE